MVFFDLEFNIIFLTVLIALNEFFAPTKFYSKSTAVIIAIIVPVLVREITLSLSQVSSVCIKL